MTGVPRRRIDKARMKARALRLYPHMGKRAIKLADHLACCSCLSCGNQRKYDGLTVAERRAMDSMDYQEKEKDW